AAARRGRVARHPRKPGTRDRHSCRGRAPMIHENRPLLTRIRPWVFVFDGPLAVGLALLVGISLATMYSAAIDYDGRMFSHVRNLSLAFVAMWAAACLP